jgi:hypothetical protein
MSALACYHQLQLSFGVDRHSGAVREITGENKAVEVPKTPFHGKLFFALTAGSLFHPRNLPNFRKVRTTYRRD